MSRCDVPRLLAWASDNGVRLHPSVEVRATVDRGLGVFATGPLAAGVPILSVPSGLLLSPLRAARSETPPSLAAVREQIARLSATLTLRLTDELALIALLLRREGAPLPCVIPQGEGVARSRRDSSARSPMTSVLCTLGRCAQLVDAMA